MATRAFRISALSRARVNSAAATEVPFENAKREVTRQIKALGREGKVKKAVDALADAARIGIPIDTQLATTLVDACAQNQKMELAETLFDDLFREYVTPDDVTFCSLIRGYAGSAEFSWVQIQKLLLKMETDFNMKPTITVYNALLEICALRNDVDRAEAYIEQMAAESVVPDAFTLRAVRNRRALRKLVKQLNRELTAFYDVT